jgi:2,3-bisphosphoglycerate-independent phosphoglycerate mutase
MPRVPRPLTLIILDGWGYSEDPRSNAILNAQKPTWDSLWRDNPHTLILGSGTEVGLPPDQMGNSEVGHLNLGAGRVVYQEYTRIENAIADRSFFGNRTLTDAVDRAVATGKAVHILGLLSPGGVHSHDTQIQALVEMAASRGAKRILVHAFLDGRDTPPKSAHAPIAAMEATCQRLGAGRIATIIGRYFAMDRDHRWPRIQAAYELITSGKAAFTATSAAAGLDAAYARGESDEFVQATAIVPPVSSDATTVADGDVVIFANYRSDRARQITRAFVDEPFEGFPRPFKPKLSAFVSLTEYSKDFSVAVAYPPERLKNAFGPYIARRGLRQLRIAETEKYAHVTFFFNGGEEAASPGEDRILVPSPNVATYDLKPEMSAAELTDKLIGAVETGKYDVIICNYANPDMVGHTGNFDATVKAIEALDRCLERAVAAIRRAGGEILVTADHGNAELLTDETTGQPHTAHTFNPVPLIYIGRPARLAQRGVLGDVAPTLLYLLGIEQPSEMTGRSLVELL